MSMVDLAIPEETALKLCEEVRAHYKGKFWTAAGLQCWGCIRFSKGDPARRCLYNAPGCRGCTLINRRFAKQQGVEYRLKKL